MLTLILIYLQQFRMLLLALLKSQMAKIFPHQVPTSSVSNNIYFKANIL